MAQIVFYHGRMKNNLNSAGVRLLQEWADKGALQDKKGGSHEFIQAVRRH
jgi:hypothetical protein